MKYWHSGQSIEGHDEADNRRKTSGEDRSRPSHPTRYTVVVASFRRGTVMCSACGGLREGSKSVSPKSGWSIAVSRPRPLFPSFPSFQDSQGSASRAHSTKPSVLWAVYNKTVNVDWQTSIDWFRRPSRIPHGSLYCLLQILGVNVDQPSLLVRA